MSSNRKAKPRGKGISQRSARSQAAIRRKAEREGYKDGVWQRWLLEKKWTPFARDPAARKPKPLTESVEKFSELPPDVRGEMVRDYKSATDEGRPSKLIPAGIDPVTWFALYSMFGGK